VEGKKEARRGSILVRLGAKITYISISFIIIIIIISVRVRLGPVLRTLSQTQKSDSTTNIAIILNLEAK
jgi:hypothetical protein